MIFLFILTKYKKHRLYPRYCFTLFLIYCYDLTIILSTMFHHDKPGVTYYILGLPGFRGFSKELAPRVFNLRRNTLSTAVT